VNHRELVLSARKKARFVFLALPEDLQDQIVDGLDGQTLTLQEASKLVASRGHSLSHEAIAGYYRAVRTERRLLEVNQELSRIIAEFAAKPQKEALEGLANLVIATAVSGLADGSVGIKDVDLPKMINAIAKASVPDQENAAPAAGPTGLSAQAADKIRRQILGIVSE
jgi:hypothetical protein